jgi:hypothetical protein
VRVVYVLTLRSRLVTSSGVVRIDVRVAVGRSLLAVPSDPVGRGLSRCHRWHRVPSTVEMSYCYLFVNRRSLSRVRARGAAMLVPFVSAGVVAAQTLQPPSEAYRPAAVVNLLDPFGCAPASISGNVGEVQVGSTVTLQLMRADGSGEVLTTVTATPGVDGHAHYSIPVPLNRFGPVIIRATGTTTVGQPFAIETSGTIVACPENLPATGSSGIGSWLRGGTAAVLAGAAMVVVAMRRRHTLEGAGA